jgi:hypothetical protein
MSSFMDNAKEKAEIQAQHKAIWDQIYQRQREQRWAKDGAESSYVGSDTNKLTLSEQDCKNV